MSMKRIIKLIISILCITILAINTKASNYPFETLPMSDSEYQSILENAGYSINYKEPEQTMIKNYAVSDTGVIALGLACDYGDMISVYNSDMQFLYTVNFYNSGSYDFKWYGNDLAIYYSRGRLIEIVDTDGNVKDIVYTDNADALTSKWIREARDTEKQVGDNKYILSKNAGIFSILTPNYGKLTKEDVTGNISVLYEVNPLHFGEVIGIIGFVGTLLAFFAFLIVFVKKQSYNRQTAY